MVSIARKNAYPDLATTMAIATELVASVEAAVTSLPAFFSAPGSAPLSPQLGVIASTASITGLRAAALVAETGAAAARVVEQGSASADTIRTAVPALLSALQSYFQSAADGRIGSGLLLYPAYVQAASHLAGFEALTAADLFLPVRPLHGDTATAASSAFLDSLGVYGAEFQTALGAYRSAADRTALRAMRSALVTLEAKRPPPQIAELLSLAITYHDALTKNEDTELGDTALLEAISQQLAGLADGKYEVPDALVSALLYAAAKAASRSGRTRRFVETYELERLLAECSDLPPDIHITAALTVLGRAQRDWESCVTAAASALPVKTTALELARTVSNLNEPSLRALAVSFATLTEAIAAGKVPVEARVGLFGASLLTTLHDHIELLSTGRHVDPAVANYYKDGTRALLGGQQPAGAAIAKPQTDTAFIGIVDEIKSTMQSIEMIIDHGFRSRLKDDKFAELQRLFTLISAALEFMELTESAGYVERLASLSISALESVGTSDCSVQDEQARIAASVMQLNNYFALVYVDAARAAAALAQLTAPDTPALVSPGDCNTADGTFDRCSDPELGAIFFEEARDVIDANIRPGIALLRADMSDDKAFLEVRRGFHTLKGSARMIDLARLGQVAECLEAALNIVRDNAAVELSAPMLDWLEGGADYFARAIATLEQGSAVSVDTQPFCAVYEQFRDTSHFSHASDAAPVAEPAPLFAPDGPADPAPAASPRADIEPGALHEPSMSPPELAASDIAPFGLLPTDATTALPEPVADAAPPAGEERAPELTSAVFAAELDPTAADLAPTSTPEEVPMAFAVEPGPAEEGAPAFLAPAPADVGAGPVRPTNGDDDTNALDESEHSHSDVAPPAIAETRPAIQFADSFHAPSTPAPPAEPPAADLHQPANAPSPAPAPDHFSRDGHAASMPAVDSEPIMPPAVPEPSETAAADIAFTDISPPPTPAITAADQHGPAAAPAAASLVADPNEPIKVGNIELAPTLYAAFVGEAGKYAIALQALLGDMIEGKSTRVPFEFVRLAHSLAGMGRTTGFAAITDVASTLETWGSMNQDHDIMFSKTSAATLADAARLLAAMVAGVESRIEPASQKWVVSNMLELIELNEHFVLRTVASDTPEPSPPSVPAAIDPPRRRPSNRPSPAAPGLGSPRPQHRPRTAAPTRPVRRAPVKDDSLPVAIIKMLGRAARWAYEQLRIK